MAMQPSLADRLRAVVGASPIPRVHTDAGGPPDAPPANGVGTTRVERTRRAADVLGGHVIDGADGLCIVVDRRYGTDACHGRRRVGEIVALLRQSTEGLGTLARAWPSPGLTDDSPFAHSSDDVDSLCVVDLETTGLAGGAGTQAFLVGCARVDGDGVAIRQFLMPAFEFERAQLAALAEWMADRRRLITFNGRTFDVPLLEMRFSFNRLVWPWAALPHLDALHPARRFWRDRPESAGPDLDESSCSLGVLEKRLSGLHRVGDVPGFEIPARYFQFARDGRPEPLEAVLEHNRLDLLSTLLVCARAATLVVRGPDAAEHGHECLGLGRLYERVGQAANAEACFVRAAATAEATRDGRLRGEALRRLALAQRRAQRFDDAAAAWQALLATSGVATLVRREAREALAIHHEHRARDLGAARTLVLDVLAEPLTGGRRRLEAEHRLARLERKLVRPVAGTLIAQLDE